MRKKILHVTTSLLLCTEIFASGIPTVDVAAIAQQVMAYQQQIKDYTVQLQQYEQMYSQLQQQMRMVEMQSTNLKKQGSYNWQDLGSILYKQRMVMNGVNAISYDAGNVSKKFENTYKDFSGYESEMDSADSQAVRDKIYSDRYKQITETNQNTLKGTLQKLELSYEDLDSESSTIAALKKRSESAEGNLQVLQANNDLLAYLIDEVRKLRVTMMDQSNAMTNYLAAQNNKEILQQANFEKMKEKNINSTYGKSVDTSFMSKLPGSTK